MSDHARSHQMLDIAALAGTRGIGLVSPNPAVGCVITDPAGNILGIGHHKAFGQAHAEVEAINNARANGHSIEGSTVYVTLEPCAHQGQTPPCAQALIEAKVARVVYARQDPNPKAKGGAQLLREAGIAAELSDASPMATRLSDTFIKNVTEGMPWVIGKWAQTIDGKVATRAARSKWISSERSRKAVHRIRARIDAILTGIGTVLADDPKLTARDVSVRKIARRVVIDPDLETPLESNLVRTAKDVPLTLAIDAASLEDRPGKAKRLQEAGAELITLPELDGHHRLDLNVLLKHLYDNHNVCRMMIEAGAGLLTSMFDQGLIDEARVYTAPMLMGDREALAAVSERVAPELNDAINLQPFLVRTEGVDIEARYLVQKR